MIYFQSQVDQLLKAKDEQIERLQKALELETARANAAVDNSLAMAGLNRITPGKVEERVQIKDLLSEVSEELGQIGVLTDEEPQQDKAANDK